MRLRGGHHAAESGPMAAVAVARIRILQGVPVPNAAVGRRVSSSVDAGITRCPLLCTEQTDRHDTARLPHTGPVSHLSNIRCQCDCRRVDLRPERRSATQTTWSCRSIGHQPQLEVGSISSVDCFHRIKEVPNMEPVLGIEVGAEDVDGETVNLRRNCSSDLPHHPLRLEVLSIPTEGRHVGVAIPDESSGECVICAALDVARRHPVPIPVIRSRLVLMHHKLSEEVREELLDPDGVRTVVVGVSSAEVPWEIGVCNTTRVTRRIHWCRSTAVDPLPSIPDQFINRHGITAPIR